MSFFISRETVVQAYFHRRKNHRGSSSSLLAPSPSHSVHIRSRQPKRLIFSLSSLRPSFIISEVFSSFRYPPPTAETICFLGHPCDRTSGGLGKKSPSSCSFFFYALDPPAAPPYVQSSPIPCMALLLSSVPQALRPTGSRLINDRNDDC